MDRIKKRFDELAAQAESIIDQSTLRTGVVDLPWVYGMPKHVPPQIPDIDKHATTQWRTSVASFLERLFGIDAATTKRFEAAAEQHDKDLRNSSNVNYLELFKKERAIFLSAKEEFEGEYLFEIRNLVHAEVFSNELEQAKHFLENKYDVAAAVTAGVVLETSLKRLCEDRTPPIDLAKGNGKPKATDTLVSELKSAGEFHEATAKQLRAWMNVRNDAAHGTRGNGQFSDGEIGRMIEGIATFVAAHLS